MLHISLAAEKIGSLWGLPVTNSLLATWVTMLLLFVFAWAATRKMSLIPSSIQNVAEIIVGGLYDFFHDIAGKNVQKFFPLVASLFLFILVSNWFGLLPGVGTIGFFHETKEQVVVEDHSAPSVPLAAENDGHVEEEAAHGPTFTPLLRAGTADLNLTFALSLIAVIAVQLFGFVALKLGYLGKFFNFKSPMAFGLGLMELISEISRILSFAFRLFGNIFAGEVLLAVMAFLLPFIVPIPFLALEIFVGLIQALVFSMLTAVFLNMAMTHHDEAH